MVVVDVGLGVELRPVERGDRELLSGLFGRLSKESVRRRFLSPIPHLGPAVADRLLDIDHRNRGAVGAFVRGQLVAVALFFRGDDPEVAEVAIVVAGAFQRRGIVTRLLTVLRERALAAGAGRFAAVAQADNRPAIALLRGLDSGLRLAVSAGFVEGTVELSR